MADPRHLSVLMDGVQIGDLVQEASGQLVFTYNEAWRASRRTTPLSLSLPLARAEHRHRAVDPYLRGLLPDNQDVLDRWGRRYGVSPNNPFALLRHVGEDVAGAAQFVRDERLEESQEAGSIEPVTEGYIEERLRSLREDRAAWTDTRGEFSLAGAQSKFALARNADGSWGIPHGRKATTHIFKPPLPGLANQEVNEHLCLQAALKLGMPTARSEVMTFGIEPAIVVERYDRIVGADGEIVRVHQEDMCQALGVRPERKYQRDDGGPGPARLIAVFRENQTPTQAAASVETFCRALAFNWVIYGPDAHAKNYSLLLAGDEVRLAPLYDIASVAAYPEQYNLGRMVMAMSVNGKYQNSLLNADDWRALGLSNDVEPDEMVRWVRDVVANAAAALSDAVAAAPLWVHSLDMTLRLLDGVAVSAHNCLRHLDPSGGWN
jgi:serine/threonine-protein kinase HipA